MNCFKHLSRLLFPQYEIVAALARVEALAWINLQIGVTLMADFTGLEGDINALGTKSETLKGVVDGLVDTVEDMAKDILGLRADGTPGDNQVKIDALRVKAQAALESLKVTEQAVKDADAAAEIVEPPVPDIDPPAPPVEPPVVEPTPPVNPDDIAML